MSLLYELLAAHGPLVVQETIKQSAPNTIKDTHVFLHHIGEYLYETQGDKGIFACKNYYLLACKHGFIESLMAKDGMVGIKRLLKTVNEQTQMTPNERIQISHGIGHGFENYFKYDLPHSLAACDELLPLLPTASPYWCYYGAFMENAVSNIYDGVPVETRLSKNQHPLSPCKDLPERYHYACFTSQPRLMNWLFDRNFDKIISTCNAIAQSNDRTACFQGIATLAVLAENPFNKNTEKVLAVCRKLPDPYDTTCVIFAAQMHVWLEDYSSFPIDLCKTLSVENDRTWCGKYLVDGIIIMEPDQQTIKRFCTNLPIEMADDRCVLLMSGQKIELPLEYLDTATPFQNIPSLN